MQRTFWKALAFVLVVSSARAEDLCHPARGFLAREQMALGTAVIGGLDFSPEGHPIVYHNESGEVRIYQGGVPVTLATLTPGVWGAFLAVVPGGQEILFADSGWSPPGGNIFSVPIEGGEAVKVDSVDSAFDIAFDGEGRGFLSACTTQDNGRIVLLDRDPENQNKDIVVGIPGWSGPLALDAAGNLYYGTARALFEGRDPLEPQQRLVRFRPEQIEPALAGQPLDFSEGEIIWDDLTGFMDMVWADGTLVYTDMGAGTVYAVDTGGDNLLSPIATFESPVTGMMFPSYLAFREGPRTFDAGAGTEGGSLLVYYSDFQTLNNVVEIYPDLYFVRGRVNDGEQVDLSDAVSLLAYLFTGGEAPDPLAAGDVNDDGGLDISDPIYLLNFLFLGGPSIPAPYPEPGPDE